MLQEYLIFEHVLHSLPKVCTVKCLKLLSPLPYRSQKQRVESAQFPICRAMTQSHWKGLSSFLRDREFSVHEDTHIVVFRLQMAFRGYLVVRFSAISASLYTVENSGLLLGPGNVGTYPVSKLTSGQAR